MATAKVVPQDKKRVEKIVRLPFTTMVNQTVVTYEDQPARIQLDLSQDEALTLAMIGMRVGGDGPTTRRGDMDSILAALRSAEVYESITPLCERMRKVVDTSTTSGIHFTGR